MQAGKLNRQIVIEAPSTAQDALGAPLSAWIPVLRCWAQITTLDGKGSAGLSVGREIFSARAGFISELKHRVSVRFTRTAILPGMRVLYGKRFLTIQLVHNPDESNQQIDLICVEQTG